MDLDTACRQQQVNEGWFGNVAEVPEQAISMSVHQILQSQAMLCISQTADWDSGALATLAEIERLLGIAPGR